MGLSSNDRILFLAPPSVQDLAATARILMQGVAVVLGDEAELQHLRSALSEFDNVLFLDAAPDRIPWRSAYFTKVLVPPHLERILPSISRELTRLLSPEGEIIRSGARA